MTRASGQTQSVVVAVVVAEVEAETAGLAVVVAVAGELRAEQELAEVCGWLSCSMLGMRWPAVVADQAKGTRCCIHRQLWCSDRQ